VQYLCDLIDQHSGNVYTFEQIRYKLNTNNFLKYNSLVSNDPKYIKDQQSSVMPHLSLSEEDIDKIATAVKQKITVDIESIITAKTEPQKKKR
jgi:hypothetical protein